MKKLLKIPYYLLLTGVVSIGILLLATLVPVPGNFKVKIVKSGSMEPTIMTGGIVVIKPAVDYKVGDVITFGKDTKTDIPTTHRIVAETGSGSSKLFTTKGDANDTEDSKQIKYSEIRGKVLFSISYIGYILDFARKPIGFILLVGIPALIVICDELLKILREVVRLQNRKRLVRKVEQDRRQRVVDLRAPAKAVEPVKYQSNFNLKVLATVLIIGGPLLGSSSIGSTISYYHESESSTHNMLQASLTYADPAPQAFALPVEGDTLTTQDVVGGGEVGTSSEEKLIEEDKLKNMSDEINAGDEVVVEGEEKKDDAMEDMPMDGEMAPEAETPAEDAGIE